MAVPGRADSFFIPAGCSSSWRRHGYANDACLPAASRWLFPERRACVSDPLPSPQPSLSPTPAHHQATKLRGLLFATGHASLAAWYRSSLHISTHYTLWPVYHMKQNKTKQNKAGACDCESELLATCHGCFLCVFLRSAFR